MSLTLTKFNIYNLNTAKAIPIEDVEQALNTYKANTNYSRLYINNNNNNFGYYLAGLLALKLAAPGGRGEDKKVIPENIYELLTPVALAHLIMGDGTAQSSGLRICTDSFEIQDVVRLINVLIIKYRLNCTLHTDRGRFRVYINKNSMHY